MWRGASVVVGGVGGGTGDAPRVRPCPGFPPRIEYGAGFSWERRWGTRGTTRGVVKRGDGDRRASAPALGSRPVSSTGQAFRGNDERGTGVRACASGSGVRGGRPAHPPLPWVPAPYRVRGRLFAGTTRGGRGVRACASGSGVRGGRPARPPLPWVPAPYRVRGRLFAGTTSGGRGGSGRSRERRSGVRGGGRPARRAPALGSRFRGNDEWGTGERREGS